MTDEERLDFTHDLMDYDDLPTCEHCGKPLTSDLDKEVSWIGMGPEQAAQLGAMLIQKARQVSKVPLAVTI